MPYLWSLPACETGFLFCGVWGCSSRVYLLSSGQHARMPTSDRTTQQAGAWTVNSHLTDDMVFWSWGKRKQWDSGLQRRDPDSKELTKLGLGMTEATACVFRKHVWGSPYDSWDLCSSCRVFVQQFNHSHWYLQHAPALLPTLRSGFQGGGVSFLSLLLFYVKYNYY